MFEWIGELWQSFSESVQQNQAAWFWGIFGLGIVVMIIGVSIQGKMQSTMKKWSEVDSGTGLTGAAASEKALKKRNVSGVAIIAGQRPLGDNFNPKTNQVTLSPGILNGTSVAALAVSMHETGHVIQHHKGSAFMKFRNIFLIPAQIGASISSMMFGIAFFGFIFDYAKETMMWFIGLGILGLAATTMFQLITIPVEKQASRNALQMMVEDGIIKKDSEEYLGAQQCLWAAGNTYVVAALMSIVQLVKWLVILAMVAGRRR